MWSAALVRKIALVAGASAIVGSGALTACSAKDKPAETKPSSSPTSTAVVTSTEKVNIGSFTPSITAKPAPTALPGNVITGN